MGFGALSIPPVYPRDTLIGNFFTKSQHVAFGEGIQSQVAELADSRARRGDGFI
jgi:hypothetical protein